MYPEYPRTFDAVQKPKKIRSDVWKKWKHDSLEDIQMAFNQDILVSFEPEIFMKDKKDIEHCKEILVDYF